MAPRELLTDPHIGYLHESVESDADADNERYDTGIHLVFVPELEEAEAEAFWRQAS